MVDLVMFISMCVDFIVFKKKVLLNNKAFFGEI